MENERGVSILSNFSNLFEKLIYQELRSFPDFQRFFRKDHKPCSFENDRKLENTISKEQKHKMLLSWISLKHSSL